MMMVPISISPTRTSSLFFIVCSSRSGSACEASCLKMSRSGSACEASCSKMSRSGSACEASCSKMSRSGSACEASCLKIRGEEKCGDRIQNEDRDRGDDDGLRGAAPDTLRAHISRISLVCAEERDRSTEKHSLDHAVHNLKGSERQAKSFRERGSGHVRSRDGGQHRGTNPNRVG